MKELSPEVWQGAWRQWPNRKLIHCSYCNGIHPDNELCFARYKTISEGRK